MSSRCFRLAFFTLLGLVNTTHGSLAQSSNTSHKGLSSTPQPAILNNYGRLPLAFVRNDGQTDKQVQYLAHSNNVSLFLTPTEAVFSLSKPGVSPQPHEKKHLPSRSVVSSVVRMRLQAANPHPSICPMQPLQGKANYFLGNAPTKWHSNVPTYAKVRYGSVYPGVDLLYYGNNRQLEYDFVVAPHADPKRIALSFAGTRRVRIERSGELALELGVGSLRWHRPVVYQAVNGRRKSIAGRYVALGSHTVGFEVGRYEANLPLVIDPQLVYSTYLGAKYTAINGGDGAFGVTVDATNNVYVIGTTYSLDFPVTKGAFQTTLAARHHVNNAFVTKLSADGSSLIYSTYLGGQGMYGDGGTGIAVDADGHAYVTGYTSSSDFPVTHGAFQTTQKSRITNAFITKLSADGASLVYSTYLGGAADLLGDEGTGIVLDTDGHAYVTGTTYSTDFPVTEGAFQSTLKGSQNAFVTKLSADGSSLVYSTYLGGTDSTPGYGDRANGITIDARHNAYVTGYTFAPDFPVSEGAFQTKLQSSNGNAFITKLNASGSALIYSTYLGGSGYAVSATDVYGDVGKSITVDTRGNAYVTGETDSSDFPITKGAFQTRLRTKYGTAFITKLNASGSALLYSTYVGGSGSTSGNVTEVGNGITLDPEGDACITGWTYSSDFPVTRGAFQTVLQGKYGSAFITQLNATGSQLLYSTYLGGARSADGGGDYGEGIAIDAQDNVYIAGVTDSLDFPVTGNAFQGALRNRYGNAFIAKLNLRHTRSTQAETLKLKP